MAGIRGAGGPGQAPFVDRRLTPHPSPHISRSLLQNAGVRLRLARLAAPTFLRPAVPPLLVLIDGTALIVLRLLRRAVPDAPSTAAAAAGRGAAAAAAAGSSKSRRSRRSARWWGSRSRRCVAKDLDRMRLLLAADGDGDSDGNGNGGEVYAESRRGRTSS